MIELKSEEQRLFALAAGRSKAVGNLHSVGT